jgi:hypothetical protein
MFNLFKSKAQKSKELIEEIHFEFDSATERLLSEAKEILANSSGIAKEKAERLKRLGFNSAKPVAETKEQEEVEKKSNDLANKIVYFQQFYPSNKFITEQEAERICKKYGLALGPVGRYIGDVPEKNLREIEQFQLRQEDGQPVYNYSRARGVFGGLSGYSSSQNIERMYSMVMQQATQYIAEPTEKTMIPEYKICASIKDFDTSMMRVEKGYKLIDDPIVLCPVNGGYLIVSKWGLEADDEALVNEKMN